MLRAGCPSCRQEGGRWLRAILPVGKRDAFRERQALGKQCASSTLWAGARAAGDGTAQFLLGMCLPFSGQTHKWQRKVCIFGFFGLAQVCPRQNDTPVCLQGLPLS